MPSRILRLWNPDAAAWEEVGDSRLTAHVADEDPHPQYLTAAEGGGGAFVSDSGDTMSGTLAFLGSAVDSGGAIKVTGSAAPAVDKVLLGPGSPTPVFTAAGGSDEWGIRFRATSALSLVGVRWYRHATGNQAPTGLRLWDTTTSLAVWSAATPTEFTDTAVGWKEYRLPGGTEFALVVGRSYALAYGAGAPNQSTLQDPYVPVPEAPLVFENYCRNTTPGTYPGGASVTIGYPLDGIFRASTGGGGGATAQSGAIRLPNGAAGALAWRNAGDTADQAPPVSAADALTFNGSALLTQAVADPLYLSPTEGDAAYLKLTGGALSGALTVAAPSGTALEVKTGTAPGTTRLQVAQTGTVTLTPDAGQPSLSAGAGTNLHLTSSGGNSVTVNSGSSYVHCTVDNTHYLGHPSFRFYGAYITAGVTTGSSAEAKQDITPLSPEDALAAVRATDPVLFDYRPPERTAEWYELPDDPEEAATVLEQRLRAAPLEEGARHQAGVVLDHDTYHTDPLFQTGDGQTNASNSFGVLLAALKAVDARLTALEGA